MLKQNVKPVDWHSCVDRSIFYDRLKHVMLS